MHIDKELEKVWVIRMVDFFRVDEMCGNGTIICVCNSI